MAATFTATSTHLLLRRLLSRPLSLSSAVSATTFSLPRPSLSLSLLPSRLLSTSPRNSLNSSAPHYASEKEFEEIENELDRNEDKTREIEEGDKSERVRNGNVLEAKRKVPNLTVKEKKELGSFANSLGEKLKSQQVGKSGVTDNVVFALGETLEANELLKLKIHRSCPGELDDVVRQLEQATGAVVVGQIGRTVILYKPSLSKLKAEEKKEQARRNFARKKQRAQTAFMQREQRLRRPAGHVRFGSQRSEKVSS